MRNFKANLGTVCALGAMLSGGFSPAEAKPKHPVLGFYTSWAPPSVRYDKITHLMYAFLDPSSSGSISGSVDGGVVSAAHNAGVKVIASIGGANNSDGFPSLAASSSGRTNFANACKSIVNGGVDGVDIDWEFPANAQDSANFTLLLKAVRAAIGSGKILSMDLAPNDEKGHWVSHSAIEVGDFYNVMAYDFTGNYPGSPVGQHSSFNQAVYGLYYWWKNRGVAKTKVILGVPFYGKNFNNSGNPVDYRDIMSANPSLSPDADQVGQTWFNGVTTITKKSTYVAENGYGGVMIWQLGGDAGGSKSLLDAVNKGLEAPEIVAIAPIGASAPGYASRRAVTLLGLAGETAGLRIRDLSGREIVPSARNLAAPAAGVYTLQAGETRPANR
jgi:chitinase